jgi:phosphatidylserine/phosphatidylglycerophosphate/cardiolipin synthase-like enzyme
MTKSIQSVLCGVLFSAGALGIWVAPSLAYAIPLEVSEAPATTLSLTVSAIQSARESLLLNIYELSSADIADALLDRIQAGVHVEIIEEGSPVGGISAAGRGIQAELSQAMRKAGHGDHFFEMTSHARAKRRFRFDHAKYAVIDGHSLLIGSENYSPTGNPQPGTKGNRGWEVFIHDEAISREYSAIFKSDSDMKAGDLVDLTQESSPCQRSGVRCNQFGDYADESPVNEMEVFMDDFYDELWSGPRTPPAPHGPTPPWTQPVSLDARAVHRITSPDTSLSGLLAMINSAKHTLDIEQMTFDSGWGKDADTSPLLDAVIAAARRGVRVRVLLNNESVFDHPGHPRASKNQDTVDTLNALGGRNRLDVSARICDFAKMGVSYIHNKGALVDGDHTLISSINWNNNSITHNREAAVLITSPTVNSHYKTLFESDWKMSEGSSRSGGARHGATADAAERAFVLTPQPLTITASGSRNSPEVDTENCPTQLHVFTLIGDLKIVDEDDASFAEISHARIEADFTRTSGAHGCVLTEVLAPGNSRTVKSRFIQIRRRADGAKNVVLEGYTPAGKVYSVRALIPASAALDGQFNAYVFNGSGPSREKLGSALIEFTPSATAN